MNLVVRQYDQEAIRLVAHGTGQAVILVRNGEFVIEPGARYRIHADRTFRVIAGEDGMLSVPLDLSDPQALRIERE